MDGFYDAVHELLENRPDIVEKLVLDYNRKNPGRIEALLGSSGMEEDVDFNRPELESEVEKYVSEHKKCLTSEVIDNFGDEEPILISKILSKLESAGKINGKPLT